MLFIFNKIKSYYQSTNMSWNSIKLYSFYFYLIFICVMLWPCDLITWFHLSSSNDISLSPYLLATLSLSTSHIFSSQNIALRRSTPAHITCRHPLAFQSHQHPDIRSQPFHIQNYTGIGLSYEALRLKKAYVIKPA